MSNARNILLASTPMHAHIAPLLQLTRGLTDLGHRVYFLTGAKFADTVRSAGAEFIALPAEADFDDDRFNSDHPQRMKLKGPAQLSFDVRNIFLPPLAAQLRAVEEAVERFDIDVVANELLFLGATAYARRPRANRVPVVALGIFPLYADDPDVAPAGLGIAPKQGRAGRIRNAALRFLAQKVIFASLQRDVDAAYRGVGLSGLGIFFLSSTRLADAVAQFTVAGFEYDRPTMREQVRFIGPLATTRTIAPSTAELPDWWGDLDGKTVVHVTQGTVANADFEELLLPTIRGLAGRKDLIVVASTGNRDVSQVLEALDAEPLNLRIEEFLPYDRLLPRVDVMVTNGGYGGVHFALEQGVPLVVAGQTEDKTEVTARVAWSGVGINLKTQSPKPEAVRAAVDAVIADPSYRTNAQRLAEEIAHAPGAAGFAALVEELVSSHASESPRSR